MKKTISFLIACSLALNSFAEEPTATRQTSRRGEAAGYSSRDASVLSMMGWGISLAVGIATFFALMDNNTGEDSGGGSGHNH